MNCFCILLNPTAMLVTDFHTFYEALTANNESLWTQENVSFTVLSHSENYIYRKLM